MFMFLVVSCLLPCSLMALPSHSALRVVREAQVPLVFGAPPLGFGAPVRYNAPNCTVVNDTITRQECIPRAENVCEDVDMPTQNIEYEDKCTNITTTLCTPVIRTLVIPEQDGSGDESEEDSGVEVEGEGSGVDESEILIEVSQEEEAALKVRRSAQFFPDPFLGEPVGPGPLDAPFVPLGVPGPYFGPVVDEKCEDQVEEHCFKNPVVKESVVRVKDCKIITSLDCQDIEEVIPRLECEPAE